MSRPAPPPPASRRLSTGGPNALELLWALLTLAALAAVVTACGIGWIALRTEAALAHRPFTIQPADLPRLLIGLAAHHPPDQLTAAVAHPWRPATIAALLAVAVAAATAAGWYALSRWQAGWRHRQRTTERHTSRVWARRRDLAGLLTRPPRTGDEPPADGRLWVGSLAGRDVTVPPATSVMAIAPTRTGKSTRLVVPNLLRWDGPAIVTSVKRDVYDLTVARRRQVGPVALFDPTGATGLPGVRWSPLLSSVSFPDATKTATWLADAAAVEDRHDAAKFWQTLATKLLAPLLFAAANTRRTITNVSRWVDRSAFDEVARILTDLDDPDASAAWQAIAALPAETRGSVLGTAMAIFRAFGSPRVRQATSATPGDTDNTLNIARLLKDNGTLYLVSPEYEQAELRPVFVALVQAVYRAAVDTSANLLDGAPLNPPLLLMLDEAGNIAPLQTLPKIAATGAGQGITLMTIWQDRAQIRAIYSDDERTVIANHTTTIWLPGSQDLDTLKLLADLIGDQWVAAPTISTAGDGSLSISEGSERIELAPPAFLRTLDHDRAVMLTGNRPPALITTHPYYTQHRWRRHIPTDTLTRHAAMHTGTGPTTAQRWHDAGWPTDHPTPTRSTEPGPDPAARGHLGRALDAHYPPVDCDPDGRDPRSPATTAIPEQLSGHPGHWVEFPRFSGHVPCAGLMAWQEENRDACSVSGGVPTSGHRAGA